MRWVCGLDLGQTSDPSAFVAVKQERADIGGRQQNVYSVLRLQRFPLGTPYPKQVETVRGLMTELPNRTTPLAVDQTGVGRAVVDMLRQARVPCWLRPVTITGGHTVSEDPKTRELTVPKKELVSALQSPLSGRRLWIDPALPDAQLLGKELANFKVKITTAANETFGAWREGQHDDLVLATALAVWLAERLYPAGSGLPATAPKGRGTLVPMPGRW